MNSDDEDYDYYCDDDEDYCDDDDDDEDYCDEYEDYEGEEACFQQMQEGKWKNSVLSSSLSLSSSAYNIKKQERWFLHKYQKLTNCQRGRNRNSGIRTSTDSS